MTQLGYAPPTLISLLLPPSLSLSLPLILSGPFYVHTPKPLQMLFIYLLISSLMRPHQQRPVRVEGNGWLPYLVELT